MININSKTPLVIAALLILVVTVLVIPVQASKVEIPQLNSTGTPVPQSSLLRMSSADPEQEEIKRAVEAYFDLRYQMYNTLELEGLSGAFAQSSQAASNLDQELNKLQVELKHAQLNQLRYVQYQYFLEFIAIDTNAAADMATVTLIEENEVVFEISELHDPKNPVVSRLFGQVHTITLIKEDGHWKLFSDKYQDYLWRIHNQTKIPFEDMLSSLKATPKNTAGFLTSRAEQQCNLPADDSSHAYDRAGAVDYALAHADDNNFNPDYPDYDDGVHGDCTNFVSQAIFEGGNASMYIPDPIPPPSPNGQSGWYLLNDMQRASSWNDVGQLYNFITDYGFPSEGPEGCAITLNQLNLGDIIQFESDDDNIWDHSVIVVEFDGAGDPVVSSHSPNIQKIHYSFFNYNSIRFLHVERSDGYPPVNTRIHQGVDDGGSNPSGCYFSSSDNEVYLGSCSGGGNISSGFRFNNIQIPKNAQIKYAIITFTVDGSYTNPINVQIYGETSGNADSFTSSSPPSTRPTTSASANWSISNSWQLGLRRTTPQLSALVEEIVSHQDWNPGNSLAILFHNSLPGTTHRRVIALERASWESTLSPARLIIAYTGGEAPQPSDTPTFTPTFTPTSTPTPTPTFTPTPTSTPVTPSPEPSPSGWAAAEMVLMQDEPIKQQEGFSSLLSEVRDQVLVASPKGDIYIDQAYQHAPEIMDQLMKERKVRQQIKKLAIEVQPLLESVVNEDYSGEEIRLDKKWIKKALHVLTKLEKKSSPELYQEIQWWKEQLPKFEGKTGTEIWEMLPERQEETQGN